MFNGQNLKFFCHFAAYGTAGDQELEKIASISNLWTKKFKIYSCILVFCVSGSTLGEPEQFKTPFPQALKFKAQTFGPKLWYFYLGHWPNT